MSPINSPEVGRSCPIVTNPEQQEIMIKSIWVDNFKSLVDFRLELEKFNCVVGLNGAGKSTVLQALDFVSQLMLGDVAAWLESRNWDSADLNSKLTKKSNIDFEVVLHVTDKDIRWSGSFNRFSLSCTRESVAEYDEQGAMVKRLLRVEDSAYALNGQRHEIMFEYQGSILSQLKESQLSEVLGLVKETIQKIRSLDLISPELLRNQSRSSSGKLGLGGERLSAFIHESGEDKKSLLIDKLRAVYPQLADVKTRSLRSGWKQLEIDEHFADKKLTSVARHVNDGMLRLMAIIMQLSVGKAFLLFDEIENGVNPELIEYLIDQLVNAEDQVLVTSHSPLILNFLEDEIAIKSVIYLYKEQQGFTRAIRLFDIPSLRKKLEFMGPGEAFADTDLTHLVDEINELGS